MALSEGTAVFVPEIEVHVSRVKIAGLNRTKNDIVTEQIRQVLGSHSLKDLFLRSLESMKRLEELNIFKHVDLKIDTDKSGRLEEESLEVTFIVEEHGWLKSILAAHAGTQSGDASLSFALRNVFGRAEQVALTSGTSLPLWGHTLQLQFIKPYYKDIHKRLVFTLGTTDTKLPFSGYQELVTGSSTELNFPTWLGAHSVSWGCNWRQLSGFSNSVPLSVRQHAGHSLKSSIKHTLLTDERDDPQIPHSGYLLKMSHEVAGFGGDTIFGKTEIQSEVYKELMKDWVLSLRLWGGLMKPYSPSCINDRFLLGGPTSLRGFGLWGVGPREQGYSLGGEVYWATGLHLFTPLPFVQNDLLRRIRFHSFVTAGNLIQCSSLPNPVTLTMGTRLSCGVGLHFRLGIAQIELNYAFPIRAQPNDQIQPGLQFGIGLDML